MNDSTVLDVSGQRFTAVYQVSGDQQEATARAQDICFEQTVEFPSDLIPREDIREKIVGRVASIERVGPDLHEVSIEFPIETAGTELTQLLNVLFGNISIKPGVRLQRFDLPDSLLAHYRGPRFGRSGLRELLGVSDRPLLATALKPMGLSPEELAELAYQFALGGIDLIKDDHGLADQAFCPFDKRVAQCTEAVARANAQTGRTCLYLPNISAPADQIVARALTARQVGAGGLLLSPGLVGFDAMRQIAEDDRIALPILSHPAMLGAFTTSDANGISHGALYGQIHRLAGADGSIFPNFGGRFSFTPQQCQQLASATAEPMGHLRPIFPTPAGGMGLDRAKGLCDFYGNDAILLIGGDLHRHGPDLAENCRKFLTLVEQSVGS